MLAYEAQRRPAVAALLARIGTVEDAEIDRSGLPKWMRDALRDARRAHGAAGRRADAEARLAASIVDGRTGDPSGTMRAWTAAPTFVRVGNPGTVFRCSIEVCAGQLLWLPDTGGVWIETVFSPTLDPAVLPGSRMLGAARKSAYIAAYKAEAARLLPQDAPSGPGGPGRALAAYGVRFS